MMPGVPERHSFDYVRHGTVDLFAALNTATGKVISQLSERHRAVDFRDFLDFLDFLDKIDRRSNPGCGPRDLRQPVHPQGTRGAPVAARTHLLYPALHPDLLVVDQPGRTVVRRTGTPLPGMRRLLLLDDLKTALGSVCTGRCLRRPVPTGGSLMP